MVPLLTKVVKITRYPRSKWEWLFTRHTAGTSNRHSDPLLATIPIPPTSGANSVRPNRQRKGLRPRQRHNGTAAQNTMRQFGRWSSDTIYGEVDHPPVNHINRDHFEAGGAEQSRCGDGRSVAKQGNESITLEAKMGISAEIGAVGTSVGIEADKRTWRIRVGKLS